MKTKGWGPWRYNWFSICSMHYEFSHECKLCKTGSWTNHWKWKVGGWIYKIFPGLWRWWVNLKFNKWRIFRFEKFEE